MKLQVFNQPFSVIQVKDLNQIHLKQKFYFLSVTDEEISIVLPTSQMPKETINREDDWRVFRIAGVLDFSLVGILAKIANLLAENQISIFAISTFNTDYLLVKQESFQKTCDILTANQYEIYSELGE